MTDREFRLLVLADPHFAPTGEDGPEYRRQLAPNPLRRALQETLRTGPTPIFSPSVSSAG